jgi:BREX system ATP-binding protein BrxC/D
MNPTTNIDEDTREAILHACRAGVAPSKGVEKLLVGRKHEMKRLCELLERIAAGQGDCTFLAAPLGNGKTLLLENTKLAAHSKQLVVMQASLDRDKRLHGHDGKTRNLVSELVSHISVKGLPEGGGLCALIETWISDLHQEITGKGGSPADVEQAIMDRFSCLGPMLGWHNFVLVLQKYYSAHITKNKPLRAAALRWLRAEYARKSDARVDLGVSRIITDEDLYSTLQLFAAFVRLAGFKGLVVLLDELVGLTHRLQSSSSRQGSFDVLLKIVNDAYQHTGLALGFVIAATPECISDPDRGLFSYAALKSRLQSGGLDGSSGLLLKVPALDANDVAALLHRLRDIYAYGDSSKYLLPDEGIDQCLKETFDSLGAKSLASPRNVVGKFVRLLDQLAANPKADWKKLVGEIFGAPPKSSSSPGNDFGGFRLDQ